MQTSTPTGLWLSSGLSGRTGSVCTSVCSSAGAGLAPGGSCRECPRIEGTLGLLESQNLIQEGPVLGSQTAEGPGLGLLPQSLLSPAKTQSPRAQGSSSEQLSLPSALPLKTDYFCQVVRRAGSHNPFPLKNKVLFLFLPQ